MVQPFLPLALALLSVPSNRVLSTDVSTVNSTFNVGNMNIYGTRTGASIPMRILECLREYSVLRCTKLYVLQKLVEGRSIPHTGNITRDFLEQFFGDEEQIGSLIDGKWARISEKQLNQHLVTNFQRFFKHRDIKLHFLPGIMVKIVPSKENKIKFSLKNKHKPRSIGTGRGISKLDENGEISNIDPEHGSEGEVKLKGGGGGGVVGNIIKAKQKIQKSSYKKTLIQMAVPVMVMPAILMGTFLPFLLPVLKVATLMSMMLNNSAFIAALIYAARTHANTHDDSPQHITYGMQGYH